jgi:hypothetical protein
MLLSDIIRARLGTTTGGGIDLVADDAAMNATPTPEDGQILVTLADHKINIYDAELGAWVKGFDKAVDQVTHAQVMTVDTDYTLFLDVSLSVGPANVVVSQLVIENAATAVAFVQIRDSVSNSVMQVVTVDPQTTLVYSLGQAKELKIYGKGTNLSLAYDATVINPSS